MWETLLLQVKAIRCETNGNTDFVLTWLDPYDLPLALEAHRTIRVCILQDEREPECDP
jgi:hypothetical protein